MTTTVAPSTTAVEPKIWTIAYRKRTGPVFHRVTNWAGTWAEAMEMAGAFGELNPGLQVWYTTTAAYELTNAAELAARVASGEIDQEFANSYLEDHGNIMVDSGKRIKVRDNGTLPTELLDADAMKVAGEVHEASRKRKPFGITVTDTTVWYASLAACLQWAKGVRAERADIFADMVRTSRTADERFTASAS
jgi:hypothetical protein